MIRLWDVENKKMITKIDSISFKDDEINQVISDGLVINKEDWKDATFGSKQTTENQKFILMMKNTQGGIFIGDYIEFVPGIVAIMMSNFDVAFVSNFDPYCIKIKYHEFIRQNKFKIVGNCFQNPDFEQVHPFFHNYE